MRTSARQLLDAAQSEKSYQAQIVELAEKCGWWTYHVHDSRRSSAGFPDLMIVRGANLHFVEVKAEKGRVQPEQQWMIDALGKVERVRARIVRPSDWPAVEAMLRAPR
jgi:ribosomal protein L37E